MDLLEILDQAIKKKGSDIFIIPGSTISIKIGGRVQSVIPGKLLPEDTRSLMTQIYAFDKRDSSRLVKTGDDDFSFSVPGVGRFRCNAYRQRNSYALVLRIVSFELPSPADFHIPKAVTDLAGVQKGLVLVTGSAGSGKSTTLACIIDKINAEKNGHIITIEDPIEFIHPHKNCIVSQREIEHDTADYQSALRAALRQAPSVILLGEMRDFETIQTAMTAAETGQLVLSTLHTVGAAKTIDRIIDVFPANQQQQVRVQLSMVLKAVVSQQLITTLSGAQEPVFEIMIVNNAIQNMIRDGKVHQMDNVIFSGSSSGMRSMDADIFRLYQQRLITAETALLYSTNPDMMAKRL